MHLAIIESARGDLRLSADGASALAELLQALMFQLEPELAGELQHLAMQGDVRRRSRPKVARAASQ
jgi:hypothetical protein